MTKIKILRYLSSKLIKKNNIKLICIISENSLVTGDFLTSSLQKYISVRHNSKYLKNETDLHQHIIGLSYKRELLVKLIITLKLIWHLLFNSINTNYIIISIKPTDIDTIFRNFSVDLDYLILYNVETDFYNKYLPKLVNKKSNVIIDNSVKRSKFTVNTENIYKIETRSDFKFAKLLMVNDKMWYILKLFVSLLHLTEDAVFKEASKYIPNESMWIKINKNLLLEKANHV